jgi:hypothetical protein
MSIENQDVDVDFVAAAATDAQLRQITSFPKARDGYYAAKVESVKKTIGRMPAGCPALEVQFKLLKDSEDLGSVTGLNQRCWINLPLTGKDGTMLATGRDMDNAGRFINAFDSDVATMPKRTDNGMMYDGEIVEGADLARAKKEASRQISDAAAELWADADKLASIVGNRVYVNILNATSQKTGKAYANISDFAGEPDATKTLANGEDMFFVPEVVEEEVPEVKKPAKKGKK